MNGAPSISPVCAFDVFDDGRAAPVAAPDSASPPPGAQYRWVHLDMTDPGVRPWVQRNLPEHDGDALLQAETRPRCDAFADGVVVNLRGVNLNVNQDADDMVSLRIWATADMVVSARVRRVFAIDAIRQEAAAGRAPKSVSAFLSAVAHRLCDRIEAASLQLEETTDEIEEIALDDSDGLASKLAAARRSTVKFRRYVGPQREALARLAALDTGLISKADRLSLRESANRTTRAVEELDSVRDRLAALQDYVDAQQTAKLGRNGYVLSIVAAVFLPLSFVTGLFGVNVAGMPGAGAPYAFALLSLGMLLLGLLLILIFRRIRWL